MQYWLLKSEPDSFSIDALANAPAKTAAWDGVRNYQARNFIKQMKKGDQALFYHSSCAVPGVAGVISVVREAYPDATAFDPKDHHYDPDSNPSNPRWFMVDVRLKRKLKRVITLDELRAHQAKQLKNLLILKRGNRLSVTPVAQSEFEFLLSLE